MYGKYSGCCAYDECHGCEDYWANYKWEVFCNTFYWIAMNSALVELNKILILDLGKSEELLAEVNRKYQKRLERIRS